MYEEKEIKFKKRKSPQLINKKITKNKKKSLPKINIKLPSFLNNIKWKELIVKLGILIIVMLLITFVISRINKNNIKNKQFLENKVKTITTSMIDYYNPNNLPHLIGDSTSLVLEELINQKVLNPIKNYKNEKCDLQNSYIIITKITDIEYRLKIYLICQKEEITKETELICFDSCQIKK